MSASPAVNIRHASIKKYRLTQIIIARFIARRSIRSSTFVALTLGALMASKTIGYATTYPGAHERVVASAGLAGSIGLVLLYGAPHHIEVVSNFAAWYAICLGVLIGGIWALLLATKTFRGNEESGRWDLLLAGPSTNRSATANAIGGLGASLMILFIIMTILFIIVGRNPSVNYSVGSAFYLALATISASVIFMAIGAFTSQIMPTRARAAGLAAAIFGVCFLVRAAGDITSEHWLLNISPLGWIEQLQPIYAPQPFWFIPIMGLVGLLVASTVYIAGKRDVGSSYFEEKGMAPPHTFFLRGPLSASLRLTRGGTLAWLLAIIAFAGFFGAFTKTAATALTSSPGATHLLKNFAQNTTSLGSKAFLGIVFFLVMTLIMTYVASAVSAIREDEARGYLDNFLVGPISRLRWLTGRIALVVIFTLLTAVFSSIVIWFCLTGQGTGVSYRSLLFSGLNIVAPVVLVLGIGIFALGVLPRLTSVITYGIIAWSFLLQLLSSGLNLSHWVLATSIFSHVAFAPAVDPNWGNNWLLMTIGLTLAVIGCLRFTGRDITPE